MNHSVLNIAHVVQSTETGSWQVHSLEEHLLETARLASKFAQSFGCSDWAYLAGIWHDLGKYRPLFQSYIKTKSGYDPDAHLETNPGRVNHSSAGAIHAVRVFPGGPGKLLAYLIAGHHAGLPNWQEGSSSDLQVRLEHLEDYDDVPLNTIPEAILDQSCPASRPLVDQSLSLSLSVWLRMLFSCLVDADFLDTEQFMQPDKSKVRASYASLAALTGQFHQRYSARFNSEQAQQALPLVTRARNQVFQACTHKASRSLGFFSLNVPTGGGKTLSSMAFALDHAKQHNLERVIYVIPYTSILEQTGKVFREYFDENVIEHHSTVDPALETQQSRLACENWDAPIILTTSVQFFESLFATRTSRVRKLHHIANSVVVLDEVQLLPPEYLEPILQTLHILTRLYNVSFVFCTATQPVFNLHPAFSVLPEITPIIDDPLTLYQALKRTEIHFPVALNRPVLSDWSELAQTLAREKQVLCIVNTRKQCRTLYEQMPGEAIHLSALMCSAHRFQTIETIKAKLSAGEEVRVISTNLVEAGVDLDFPIVYRALAGLDSIIQAAGRCNREGRLSMGQVHVFVPPEHTGRLSGGLQQKAVEALMDVLYKTTPDVNDPILVANYFNAFYSKANSLDREGIMALLSPHHGELSFREAAKRFRFVKDEDETIFVPYERGAGLIDQLQRYGPNRQLLRQLQRYAVSVPKPVAKTMVARGDVCLTETHGYAFLASEALYDKNIGLLTDVEAVIAADALVV